MIQTLQDSRASGEYDEYGNSRFTFSGHPSPGCAQLADVVLEALAKEVTSHDVLVLPWLRDVHLLHYRPALLGPAILSILHDARLVAHTFECDKAKWDLPHDGRRHLEISLRNWEIRKEFDLAHPRSIDQWLAYLDQSLGCPTSTVGRSGAERGIPHYRGVEKLRAG